ncbi:MAG: hypothetical protein ISQ74_02745 [Puniceicoccaceae bacterium]|nr:hypothetical protein [Puniceicoccaceae bacterium]
MIKKTLLKCIICILSASTGLHAINWNPEGTDGDWNTPASWNGGVVPTASDEAKINQPTSVTVANVTTPTPVGFIHAFSHNGDADASRTQGTYDVTDAAGDASGTGADFRVQVNASGVPSVRLLSGGTGYIDNETITIADSSLGSGGGAAVVVTVIQALVDATAVANDLVTGFNSTITVNTGAVLALANDMHVGNAGDVVNGTKNGTVQLDSGGQIVVNNVVRVGSWETASEGVSPPSAVLEIAGGTLSIHKELYVGVGGNGTLNLSGGTVSFAANEWQQLRVGSDQGDGVINMTGGNLVTNGIQMDNDANSAARINLDGGILEVTSGWAGTEGGNYNNGVVTFSANSVIAISDGVFQWKGTNKRPAIGALVASGYITFATSTLSGSYAADIAEESWTSSDGTTTLYADTNDIRDGYTTVWALSNDTDGDGLADGVETNTGTFLDAANTGTDPNDPDTDDDGLVDGVETNTGTFVSASDTGTNPHLPDTDSDGLRDDYETSTGVYVSATDTGTNPLLSDTDGDTISDGVETGLDPNTDSTAAINLLPSTGGGVEQSVHDAVVTELANAREARPGSTVIDVANDLADITLRVEQTSDVSDWSNATTSDHTIQLSAPAGASFYRFTIPE